MNKKFSPILTDYLKAFERHEEPFVFYYSFGDNKQVEQLELTRGEFWSLAKKAGTVIREKGCKQGDCFALFFGGNHYLDLAFRMAATITGTIPVTINWQADTIEQIFYKLERTGSRLIIADSKFSENYLNSVRKRFSGIPVFNVSNLQRENELADIEFANDVDSESDKIIVFTSGTTGKPKGALLPYRCYNNNRSTFEQFLEIKPDHSFAVLIVNPLHHANSTAITDWALRRPGSQIHLVEKYGTEYWKILSDLWSFKYDRLVAPTVSRHFDFLENLDRENRLPVKINELKGVMGKTDFLIGSAPVGPSTIKRLQHYSGRIPNVRFGSTETCLQVIGIPYHLSEESKLSAFQKGWEYKLNNEMFPGYYIGRPHYPYTEVRIVESIESGDKAYMRGCSVGRPGYLVTRGENIMSGYIGNPEATEDVFHQGWYTGLKDICFALKNDEDDELDYYWVSRESMMLIRGGANYAYDQINSELIEFMSNHYKLPKESFDISVVGVKIDSEHEDACCVTIELRSDNAKSKREVIGKTFVALARQNVSKASRPDYVKFGQIPRNFKGAPLVKDLALRFK